MSPEKSTSDPSCIRYSQTTPNELGFRIFHGANCGFSSCCRTNTHMHCKECGFGTSQIANGVAHKRICAMNPENQSKDFNRLPSVSDPSVIQHDTLVRSTQSFPYYSTMSQTPVSMTLPSQSSSNQSTKIMTSQPSAMFNFVLPSQNTQYNPLYGTQNVFPNPNMFSPSSFNGFSQLDPWLPQPRLIPPGVHSGGSVPVPTEMLNNTRNHYEKLDTSNSPSSHGCCGRIENTAIGMCSPLTAEAYKAVSKELSNFTTKIDSQNWYCNPQNMMGFGMQNSQQPSCKYNEPFPSCSVSQISLLLLEQTDLRQPEECINVEDLCFDSPQGKTNEPKSTSDVPKLEDKSRSILSKDLTTGELQNPFSSCMQESSKIHCHGEVLGDKKGEKVSIQKDKLERKNEMTCMSKGVEFIEQQIFPNSFDNTEAKVQGSNEETSEMSSSSDESDIIVEESDEEAGTNINHVEKQFLPPRCLVCDKTSSLNSLNFIRLQEDTPLTTTTHVSIMSKLSEVINHNFSKLKNCFICKRCLNLINVVDCLEIKLTSAKKELNDIFKTGKDMNSISVQDKVMWNESETVKLESMKENMEYVVNKNDSGTSEKGLENSKIISNCKESNMKKIKKVVTEGEIHCDICDKNYSSAYYLGKHLQHHTKSYSFYCERCGRGFTYLKKLEDHLLIHSKTSRYQCELCGKRFIQKHVLNDHLKKHKGDFKLVCSHCNKGFMRENVYNIHLRLHNKEKPFICQNCGRMFTASANLKVHIKKCSNNLPHSCLKCEKKYPLKSLLEKHISLKHDNDFKIICNVCGKGFIKKSDFLIHLKSHSDKKPHKCTICGSSYKTISNLNQHSKIHSVGGQLNCNICNKKFARKDALDDHMNHHLGKKPYSCSKCSKAFANRINLHTHLKKHDGQLKRKPCTVCGKVLMNNMKDHMRTHSGEKPFSCDKCGTLFTVKSSLNKHVRLKHNL